MELGKVVEIDESCISLLKCNCGRLKGFLSAGFSDVPELIAKHCVQFISIPFVHIFHLSFQLDILLVSLN